MMCAVRLRAQLSHNCANDCLANLQGHRDFHTPGAPRCPGSVLPALPLPRADPGLPASRSGSLVRGESCARNSHGEVLSPAPSTPCAGGARRVIVLLTQAGGAEDRAAVGTGGRPSSDTASARHLA